MKALRHRPEWYLLLLLPVLALAAPPAGEIVIRADRAEIRQAEGTGLYQGNAEMTQGPRRLRADSIRVELENGEIARVFASGEPVTLEETSTLNARAGRLVYHVRDRKIFLYEEAFIEHQGRTFEGAEVRYDLATGEVRASGDDKGRVRLVIPAEENKQDKNGDQAP
jgi:lipopolysaccharide export system protein LptA